MWPRRSLRFFDRHHCATRRIFAVIGILVITNTAFHWAMVEDVNSRSGHERGSGATLDSGTANSRRDKAALFRDRVASINKWYEDLNERYQEGKGVAIHLANDPRSNDEREPLITYITRKPSNRRPLGETPSRREAVASDSAGQEHFDRKIDGNMTRKKALYTAGAQNRSGVLKRTGANRQQIDALRESVRVRKQEIKTGRLEMREIVLPFLRESKPKLRSAADLNPQGRRIDSEHVAELERTLRAVMDRPIIEVYSDQKIRFYSQPSWLDSRDVEVMNALAGSWILGRRQVENSTTVSHVSRNNHLALVSNAEIERLASYAGEKSDLSAECELARTSTCQPAWCRADLGLVVAFHLDRVIGLNVTPPTVARELRVGTGHPTAPRHVMGSREVQNASSQIAADRLVRTVALGVTSDLPRGINWNPAELEDRDNKPLTRATSTNLEVPPDRVEKLSIFCFLLKISNCETNVLAWNGNSGNTRRPQRSQEFHEGSAEFPCAEAEGSPVQIFREAGNYDGADDHQIERLKRISRENLVFLHSGLVRQRLLQSLFIDKVFWTEAGGRRGIEDALNVIDRRIKELVTLIARRPMKTYS
ncbi:Golgi-associated kinase 1B-like [Diadema antillarum]|uniref:Golgi-associated kinase 1B-like n=1 Tax=Diadema antillarum TaxID=105358 RepID=UPI003A867696